MMSKIFIITSVIFFKNKPLSYSEYRSSFLPSERLAQTENTIKSIREKVPGAKIYLFEQGTHDVSDKLKHFVDYYSYIGNRKIVRWSTDSVFKGLGEAVGLLYASKYLPNKNYRIIKISGRYYLNNNFNLIDWNSGKFIFLKRSGRVSTRLYSFESSYKNLWKLSLILSLPFLLLNISIEKTLNYFIPNRVIKTLDRLGIQGLIGVGEQFNEFSE